ncbi:MAG: acetyl-CoA carboxylase biotin carboxyl carrier protein [Lachnospiraceae bacterium]|nr:acetyl-CoA carboxylase biotin carboxyl carrier protein [Lachnospiraceae bacterium]
MDLEKIAGLVKILEDSSLTELTVKEGETKIHLSKLDHPPVVAPAPAAAAPVFAAQPAAAPLAQAEAPAAAPAAEDTPDEEYIVSPIVGTFYSAPAPDAPAYVRVGDHVKAGQTVCILEAMKLMNEIQSEFDCEIEAVLVSNEQKVEYGHPLFRVKRI